MDDIKNTDDSKPDTPSSLGQKPRHVANLGSLGDKHCGRGVNQALDVIHILESHNIPCCITGPKALVYYGAHRVPVDWEITVPDTSFPHAKALFTSAPLNTTYTLCHPPILPQLRSLQHTYPHLTLQGQGQGQGRGINFSFFLMPAFDRRADCAPAACERSPSGIPYPRLERLAQSLLDTQNYADLEDLVDGMNLDEAWGEENLCLDGPGPGEYIREKNRLIVESLGENRVGAVFSMLSESPDARGRWMRIVGNRRGRIGVEMPRERYETRFRMVGAGDPRGEDGREV